MGNILYLLKEEAKQEDFEVKAKYLYTSDFIKECIVFIEANCQVFLFLSNSEGVVDPEKVVKPYKIKNISNKNLDIWITATCELIRRYCSDNDISEIIFLCNGGVVDLVEKRLRIFGYKIHNPIRNFKTVDSKMRWVRSELQCMVRNRISCNRTT